MWEILGNPMPPAGIYPNMSDAEYFSIAAISNSRMNDFIKSPALFLHKLQNKDEDTQAMKFGRFYHAVVLQPELVDSTYYIAEDTRQNTKAGKAAAAEAAIEGLELVKKEEYEKALAMREAVLANKRARAILEHPETMKEVSCFWWEKIGEVEIPCKCKVDILNHEIAGGIAIDLKTTADASPEKFAKSVATYGYHRQDAWYSRGAKKASGKPVNAFGFIAQEKDAPYLTGLYTLHEGSRQQGLYEIRDAITRLAECMKTGVFDGYGDDFVELDLPKWAQI